MRFGFFVQLHWVDAAGGGDASLRSRRTSLSANRVGSGNRNPLQQDNTTRTALVSDIR